jgi:hypothetical protein
VRRNPLRKTRPMHRKQAERQLARLGYEIDWSCTGHAEGYWSGIIDAIGRNCIDGDCRGEAVHGDNAADWYRNAIEAAKGYRHPPTPCPHPIGECEFHDE